MIHDSYTSSQDDVSELTRGQQVLDPLLHLRSLNIKPRADNSAFIDTSIQLHHDLSGTVIIDDFKLTNVSVLLHDLEELHYHLGAVSSNHTCVSDR